ncbi:copper resistance system multicopper oxidase [Sulfurimonas sp. MAG313]|nr:copper resistance system multicopper oxidase [Sulfurimonas sp. MAG313]MDF1880613.1 copper resistance system multicopper oxidase [Sulfurimonas sp. MAG313]
MYHNNLNLARRTFVKGIAVSSVLAALPLSLNASNFKNRNSTEVLRGKIFNLSIDNTLVNITGKDVFATAVNGMLAGPTLMWKEGDDITINVTNNLDVDSSIHWHGIILPFEMDGVPGISFDGIKPGKTFTYEFKVTQSGTYWYHSHSGFQEQSGVFGAIVIEPKEELLKYDKDYVVSLSDWSDEKPESIYRKLKISADYYNFNQRTIGDFFSEIGKKGFLQAYNDRSMWNKMRMSDRDLSDVTGYTYTYLINGQNPATNSALVFKKGEKIRLRLINSSAMTYFDIQIPGLKMSVVSTDGSYVQAVEVDELRLGVAETYDVIVEPKENMAYALFAQSIDRTGYALASLTYDKNIKATPPKMDKRQNLSMTDMGMDMSSMKGMDSSMPMEGKKQNMHMPKKDMKKMIPITPLESADDFTSTMKAIRPKYRLNDPGVGLRNNGRKVLTYADLKGFYSTKGDKYPDREIILHLTGNMQRYIWSINGIAYKDAQPLTFNYGERLRITYINDTMMNHPMHMHGMWSDLETGDDNFLVRKHTITSQPGSKISFRVTVDAKGSWAYHCHLLYHMTDMFRKIIVV